MANWYLRDSGVPIEQACSIVGHINPAAYMMLRKKGAFGVPSSDVVQRAPLLEVAAARCLLEAERSGMTREHARPFVKPIAEAAYVYLATMQLGRRSWQAGGIPTGIISELVQRLHSDDGLFELHKRLGVEGRYDLTRLFVLFTDDGLVFSDTPPEPDHYGQRHRFVDLRAVAQQIENYAGRQLFGGYWQSNLAA
jgi:hypothetical protein